LEADVVRKFILKKLEVPAWYSTGVPVKVVQDFRRGLSEKLSGTDFNSVLPHGMEKSKTD
jgi:hypothetical protein